MSGGASVAEPLSRALDEPVLATPHEVVFDPETGDLVSRSRDTTSKGEPFRAYGPGDTKGELIPMQLLGSSKFGEGKSGGRRAADPAPNPIRCPRPPPTRTGARAATSRRGRRSRRTNPRFRRSR